MDFGGTVCSKFLEYVPEGLVAYNGGAWLFWANASFRTLFGRKQVLGATLQMLYICAPDAGRQAHRRPAAPAWRGTAA